MTGSIRCIDGHSYRDDGVGWDGAHGETDMGFCRHCLGRGCENEVSDRELVDLLTNAAQLFDAKKTEGCSWSEWDQEVRAEISKALRWLTTPKQTAGIYDPGYMGF